LKELFLLDQIVVPVITLPLSPSLFQLVYGIMASRLVRNLRLNTVVNPVF